VRLFEAQANSPPRMAVKQPLHAGAQGPPGLGEIRSGCKVASGLLHGTIKLLCGKCCGSELVVCEWPRGELLSACPGA